MKKEEIEFSKAKIISAFENGESCKSICENFQLSCHPTTLLNYLKEWGTDTSPKYNSESWGISSKRNSLIKELKKEGKSHAEIAKSLGISRGRVNQILKNA